MIWTGAGIIADIATPAERGGFFGLYGMGQFVRMPMQRFALNGPIYFEY